MTAHDRAGHQGLAGQTIKTAATALWDFIRAGLHGVLRPSVFITGRVFMNNKTSWIVGALLTAACGATHALPYQAQNMPYPPMASPFPYGAQAMQMPGSFATGNAFQVTARELPGGYLINLYLQGIDPREINMSVADGMLLIERTSTTGITDAGGFSFSASSFNWRLPLPPDVDISQFKGQVVPAGIQLFIPRLR